MMRLLLFGVLAFVLGLGAATAYVVVHEQQAHAAARDGSESAEPAEAGAGSSDVATPLDSLQQALLPKPYHYGAGDSIARADSLEVAAAAAAPAPPVEPAAPAAAAVEQSPAAPQPELEVEQLAKLFAAMQPKDAARILEQMDDQDVKAILARLRERQAAAILSSLPPQRVAAISRSVMRNPGGTK
jgi:hypothetical protein